MSEQGKKNNKYQDSANHIPMVLAGSIGEKEARTRARKLAVAIRKKRELEAVIAEHKQVLNAYIDQNPTAYEPEYTGKSSQNVFGLKLSFRKVQKVVGLDKEEQCELLLENPHLGEIKWDIRAVKKAIASSAEDIGIDIEVQDLNREYSVI